VNPGPGKPLHEVIDARNSVRFLTSVRYGLSYVRFGHHAFPLRSLIKSGMMQSGRLRRLLPYEFTLAVRAGVREEGVTWP
jgi:hypothetical protein